MTYIKKPIFVEDLWDRYRDDLRNGKYKANFSFDQFVMTLDYLYIIKGIELDERGCLVYAANKSNSK